LTERRKSIKIMKNVEEEEYVLKDQKREKFTG
jgi:hypothetical protein